MQDKIERRINNFTLLSKEVKKIEEACKLVSFALKNGNKILFCGNGGSASDSNHLACEFISKFQKERTALPAISLASNNSIITAISNDYSFNEIFKRQIEALGEKNDVLIAISTSGKSKNIIEAIKIAKEKNLKVIFLTGENKTNIKCDIEINAPSNKTAEIQEMHIALGHIICENVEEKFL